MMIKKSIITAGLAVVLFLCLLWMGWGLVYANIAGAELKQRVVDKSNNDVFLDVRDKAANYDNITALELKQRVDDKSDNAFIILDIRDEAAYDQEHIPGAINIPLKELGYRLFSLDKTKDIIVYCDVGVRSKVACQILANAGFKDVYNLTGGMKAWNYAIETSDGKVSI